MKKLLQMLRDEKASAMIENVIVLPVIFVVIYSFIMTAFLFHDRSTMEAAAQRGAIYASHCVSDPNYASIVGQYGALDVSESRNLNFSSVGKNIKAYRYILGSGDIESLVEKEVKKIVENDRINWYPQDKIRVSVEKKNMFLYQDVTVTIRYVYEIPDAFGAFGLETEYEATASATVSTTDPDELIRNADLVVDLITAIDNATGNHISKALDKIGQLGDKVLDWMNVGK